MDIVVVESEYSRRKWQFSTSIRDNNLANGISNTATVTINRHNRKLNIVDLLWISWLWALLSQCLYVS